MIVQEGTLASSSARKSQREVDGSPDKNITVSYSHYDRKLVKVLV